MCKYFTTSHCFFYFKTFISISTENQNNNITKNSKRRIGNGGITRKDNKTNRPFSQMTIAQVLTVGEVHSGRSVDQFWSLARPECTSPTVSTCAMGLCEKVYEVRLCFCLYGHSTPNVCPQVLRYGLLRVKEISSGPRWKSHVLLPTLPIHKFYTHLFL